ncbi:hypothetical protein EVAR_47475_1 [Eumeta japonica]|uniref:Uncharacterized protein n=1 Tax=Eumeta variegata TaxID=151549 RepID=A0A4C1XER9_EUMVA|nr:hypothetical protein EVAR_47475_1 [Eumeta japonica]
MKREREQSRRRRLPLRVIARPEKTHLSCPRPLAYIAPRRDSARRAPPAPISAHRSRVFFILTMEIGY